MARINFSESGNEGKYTFCGVFRIEFNEEELDKLKEGGLVKAARECEKKSIDFKFFFRKWRSEQ